MWSCLQIQVTVSLIKPRGALAWKEPLASPESAKHSKLHSHLRVLPQDSQCSSLSRGFQCFAECIKGTWWCRKEGVTSAQGAADRAELQIQDLLGSKPWGHLGITSGSCCSQALLQPRLLLSIPVLCTQLGKGRWKPQELSPCSRACDWANVSTWSDLHWEIRTKQMLLAQTWLIRHLSGSASTTTTLRWLKKANRV